MVHVVNANVGAEPLQNGRKTIIGAALQGRLMQIPLFELIILRVLKLMLHIEQPNASRGGNQRCRQEDQQQRRQTAKIVDTCQHNNQGDIACHSTDPVLATVHQPQRQAVLQEEQIERSKPKHGQRVPHHAILKPPQRTRGLILGHGHCVDVTNAALVQIPRRAVVDRVRASPNVIRCQRDHPENPSQPIAYLTTFKKGAMAAVMLDGEQTDQKERVKHRNGKCQPQAYRHTPPGQRPKRNKWHHGHRQFKHAARRIRLPVFRENFDPFARGTLDRLIRLRNGVNYHVPANVLFVALWIDESTRLAIDF
mmetsp:Transcript_11422/g.18348  ORF Transcript_11422/g.18348 Transcript_11422/m.18348 type:complete len:309 (-) Transcript_11422:10-936(-)